MNSNFDHTSKDEVCAFSGIGARSAEHVTECFILSVPIQCVLTANGKLFVQCFEF